MPKLQTRPTNMALAFINVSAGLLNSQGRNAPWTARRVAVNADREIGTKTDPGWNAHLSKKTADDLQRRGIL